MAEPSEQTTQEPEPEHEPESEPQLEAEGDPQPGREHDAELEAALERRGRALAEVIKFGDPVLRSPASLVADFDADLGAEITRMSDLMEAAMGVGLAATQLGLLRRLLVYRAAPEAPVTALVNPRIEWSSDEVVTAEEGCLSIPGVVVDVERPLHVVVEALDASGDPLSVEASGLEARVIQHEVDHLDGVLMLQRTNSEQRKGAMRALREGESYAPPEADPGDDPDDTAENHEEPALEA